MKGVFYSVFLQIQRNVWDAGEDFGAPPWNDAIGFSIHRVRYCSPWHIPCVKLVASNTACQYDDHLLWRVVTYATFSSALAGSFSPLSSADCSALTRLFLPIISHTSQGRSNYSRLRGYIWFSFVGRGDTDGATRIKARCYSLMLSFTGYTGVWHKRLSFFVTDSALDDFVLMHCVFIPDSQLCPVLMSQYPFSIMFPNLF